MRGLTAFLFLINTSFVISALDRFFFEISFQCGYHQRDNFNYNVQFFEKDFWIFNSNDEITHQRIGNARPGEAHFTMSGSQNGDEAQSNAYEVVMRIYHDCTEYRSEAEVNLFIIPVCTIGNGTCHYTISKDIKDLHGSEVYTAKLKYE